MQPYQVSLAGNTFGPGTDVQLTSITGLRDMPPLRSGNVARGGMDGNFPGFNYLDARVITATFHVTTTLYGTPEQSLQNLSAAFQNIADPSTVATTPGRYMAALLTGTTLPTSVMLVQLPARTWPLACFGRATAYNLDVDNNYQYNWQAPTGQFTVDDGALYDWNVQQQTCGLPAPTAGLTFPVTFPATFGASTGGVVTVTNTGNYQTWPVLRITGPCTSPTVTLNATGAYLGINITLGATDVLIIDMFSGTATLNGTALRNNLVTIGSTFFAVPPGAQNVTFGTADSVAVAAQMTVAIMSAYGSV